MRAGEREEQWRGEGRGERRAMERRGQGRGEGEREGSGEVSEDAAVSGESNQIHTYKAETVDG